MEMRWYLEILQRRKWVIVLTTIMTVVVAGLGSYLMTPIYSASTMVRIAQMQDNPIYYDDLSYSVRLMNTYTRLLKSNPFLEEVIQRLGLNISPEALAKRIKAEALGETELLKITAESPDPREAMEVANMLGALLVEQGQKVYSGQGKTLKEMLGEQLTIVEESLREDRALLQSLLNDNADEETAARIQDLNTRIRSQEEIYATLLQEYNTAQVGEEMRANSISVVEPAITPKAPSKPRTKLNVTLGALVGLVGGIGLAFLLENLDLTLYSLDEVGAAGGLVSGSISRTPKRNPQGIIVLELDGPSSAGEAYRILRTSILSVASRIARKVLLITTVGPPGVKSRVLASLAAAMAQAGQKVVLVDADFREPRLHQLFDLSNELGVSNIIDDHSGVETALQETKIQGLKVLTSGPVPPNPARLLGSPKMQELVWELAIEADMVLLNTPPISHAADVAALAPIVDGVLLIADRDQAAGKPIQRALQEMDKVGAKVLGLLVDGAKAPDGVYYPRYRYLTSGPKSVPEFGLR